MNHATPTEAELEILRILWERGPSSVRGVHEIVGRGRSVRYTTTLKTLQIMHEKGFVTRDASERAHVYEAALEASIVERSLVRDLLETVFGGSAKRLVLNAISEKGATPEEIEEIKALLEKLDERK